ncbi:MAG: Gfo/Idh/MocA family oxidoreductase [Myxococcota bacterium]|jgi:predicted dehydrogenase
MTLRVAVVGLGVMGRYHLAKMLQFADVRVACVVDRDPAVLASLSLPDGVARCGSLAEAPGFDAAVVSTPPSTHYPIAAGLLARGVNVLVEKPVCTNAADAIALVAMARNKKLVCASGHSERFNPALVEIMHRTGTFLYAEAERIGPFPERSVDADVIQDLMIHDLDALYAFEPGRAVDVRSVGLPVLTRGIDIANARIEFEGGQVAMLTASRVSFERRRKFRVFSRGGYYSADLIEKSLKIVRLDGPEGDREITADTWKSEPADQLLEQDRKFVTACIDGVSVADDAERFIPALELADRVRAVMKKP